MRNNENSITISTAGHGDPAKDYAGLRAALYRWEMRNGLRDTDGFIKNSLWKGKNRRNLFRRRGTTLPKPPTTSQTPTHENFVPVPIASEFPLTLAINPQGELTVTDTHANRKFPLTFPEFLAQR
jgi:hypothetical protein